MKSSKEGRVHFGCRLPVSLVARVEALQEASGNTFTETVEQLLVWAVAKAEVGKRRDEGKGVRS